MGDHTESFQVDYDPSKITYAKLLDLFWESHNPCARSYSRQYMSAVFYMTEEQKRAALDSMSRAEKTVGRIQTPILPLDRFYRAEDYHQKYYLRQHQALIREFSAIYADPAAFADSTAAARVNGYLAGDGSRDELVAEIDRLGLSADGRRELLKAVAR